MATIDFYFDFLSPYSYLAFEWVKKVNKEHSFNFIPVPLGKIIKSYGGLGPAEIPPKRDFLYKHFLRVAKDKNIEVSTPKILPFNSSLGLRMALKEISKEGQFELITHLFEMAWKYGLDMGNDDELEKFLSTRIKNPRTLIDEALAPASRKLIKNNISRALSNNVFGVPTFMTENELFWGEDSIKYLDKFLRGEDQVLLSNQYHLFIETYGPKKTDNLKTHDII